MPLTPNFAVSVQLPRPDDAPIPKEFIFNTSEDNAATSKSETDEPAQQDTIASQTVDNKPSAKKAYKDRLLSEKQVERQRQAASLPAKVVISTQADVYVQIVNCHPRRAAELPQRNSVPTSSTPPPPRISTAYPRGLQAVIGEQKHNKQLPGRPGRSLESCVVSCRVDRRDRGTEYSMWYCVSFAFRMRPATDQVLRRGISERTYI